MSFEAWTVQSIKELQETVKKQQSEIIELKELYHRRKKPSRRTKIPMLKRFSIMQRDNFTCLQCGFQDNSGEKLQVDHKIRPKNGGTDEPDNLQTLCLTCHINKSVKEREEDIKKKQKTLNVGDKQYEVPKM
jgi:5-methylcytosine-specific restriction endonuclease McrA